MKWQFVALILTVANAFAYHDPDLNYHVNQLQQLQNCDFGNYGGYSYPAPVIQLTTEGVKTVAPATKIIAQPILPVQASYSSGIAYQAQSQPSSYTQTSPPVFYPNYSQNINVQAGQREVHGYVTSAGLSTYATSGVRPQATYAQAPILSKITAAPLIARFSPAPAKTSYVTQDQSQGYTIGSRASLNSIGAVHSGPVVSQVYAAPTVRYETAPALKAQAQLAQAQQLQAQQFQDQQIQAQQYQAQQIQAQQYQAQQIQAHQSQGQQAQLIAQSKYLAPLSQFVPAPPSNIVTPSVVSHPAPVSYSVSNAAQYASSGLRQYAAQAAVQYATPVKAQYVNQYAAPTVAQYSAPAVRYSTQHIAPVSQYAAQQVASAAQYPAAAHYVTASSALKVAAPALQQIAIATGQAKNVHSEFLENYDAHPKYSYEYGVNDPHTGDIKHQKEERDGEVVKGQYALVEPDGSVRTVEYVADWETGFHANVKNSKDQQH